MKKLIALLLLCGMVTFTLTGVTGCGSKDTKTQTTMSTPGKMTPTAAPTTGEEKKP